MAARFNGICIITADVARLRGFYEQVLGIASEGDDTHARLLVDGVDHDGNIVNSYAMCVCVGSRLMWDICDNRRCKE